MKDMDFQEIAVTVPVAPNGRHRARKQSNPAIKMPESGETFVIGEAKPIDALMWPLHTALWLQSETAPSIPLWSGLTVERHNRLPAPQFLSSDDAPANRPGALAGLAVSPRATSAGRPRIPQSDLAPVGWDARAVSRRQGGI